MYANDLLTTPVNLAGLPGYLVVDNQMADQSVYSSLVNHSMKKRYIVSLINMKHNTIYMTFTKNYKEWKSCILKQL